MEAIGDPNLVKDLPNIDIGNILQNIQGSLDLPTKSWELPNRQLVQFESNDGAKENNDLPRFIRQPQNQEINSGGNLKLESKAIRVDTYQWYHNGEPFQCRDNNLCIFNVGPNHDGIYSVLAHNQCGLVESDVVKVKVY